MKRLVLKRVTYKKFSTLNGNLRSHSAPCKCLLTILKCPLSVLWRCPSSSEFGYSKMTEKPPGPAPGVRLIEVSVKRELTVHRTDKTHPGQDRCPWLQFLAFSLESTMLLSHYIFCRHSSQHCLIITCNFYLWLIRSFTDPRYASSIRVHGLLDHCILLVKIL